MFVDADSAAVLKRWLESGEKAGFGRPGLPALRLRRVARKLIPLYREHFAIGHPAWVVEEPSEAFMRSVGIASGAYHGFFGLAYGEHRLSGPEGWGWFVVGPADDWWIEKEVVTARRDGIVAGLQAAASIGANVAGAVLTLPTAIEVVNPDTGRSWALPLQGLLTKKTLPKAAFAASG